MQLQFCPDTYSEVVLSFIIRTHPVTALHCSLCAIDRIYRVFQKDLNSGHRGHRTWHPVNFSYGNTLKTMPTNHHSPKMCVNCKIAFELWCKPLMGTCWSASGRRDYCIDICRVMKGAHIEHLWADFGKLGHLHYLCAKFYLILTINT